MAFNSIEELVSAAEKAGTSIGEYALHSQAGDSGRDEREVYEAMAQRLRIMQEAADFGFSKTKRTASGLAGETRRRYRRPLRTGRCPGISIHAPSQYPSQWQSATPKWARSWRRPPRDPAACCRA